jgi:uncharacterized protein (TIGR03437 family)
MQSFRSLLTLGVVLLVPLALSAQQFTFSTYLGGSGTDSSVGVAVDSTGNVFLAGNTNSTNFPVTKALQSAAGGGFVAKYDSTGAHLLAVSYTAGISVAAIALDASGNVVITGSLLTAGALIATTGAYTTPRGAGFVAKLGPNLDKFTWVSTFLAVPTALALDSKGNVYTTGSAAAGFVTTTGALQTALKGTLDAFVLKLSADGSTAMYATYLGGGAEDEGNAIAVDAAGDVYLTGATASPDFPLVSAAQTKFGGRLDYFPNWYGDAFVAKLDPNGATLLYSTYLGGTGADSGYAIAVDGGGNAYVTGGTESTGLSTKGVLQSTFAGPAADPTFPDPGGDAFVARYTSQGALSWFTYLGGSAHDYGAALALDQFGDVFVTGNSDSSGFPAGVPVHDCHIGGHPFLAELDANGAKTFVTTGTPGIGFDQAQAMFFDAGHNVVWLAGDAASQVFFASPGVAQGTFAGGDSDAFALRIDLGLQPGVVAACVLNAASFLAGNTTSFPLGSVAPGEIVSLFGAGLGPTPAVLSPHVTNNIVDTLLGGAQVFFDGIPAPLLYVGPTQINLVVPYGIKGPLTQMTVSRGSGSAGPVAMPVVAAVPSIFTYDGSGTGSAAVINQDGTINTVANPAPRGSVITFYATGAGLMTQNIDGAVTRTDLDASLLPMPQLKAVVTIRGENAQLLYAGAAPGYVAGLLQVDVFVPTGIDFGSHVPLVLQLGTFTSQLNITIAEQ